MLIYKTLGEEDLHQAFKNKEFALAFQPIMNLESDSFETFEAFIRWHHPLLGLLPPSIFMSNIERHNLQEKMTGYIFDAAIEQIINNHKSGYGDTGININLTVQEFFNPNTIVQLAEAIKKIAYPELLGLEISPQILTDYIQNNPEDKEYHPDATPSEMEMAFLEKIAVITNSYLNLGVTLALDTTDYVIGSLIRADILGFHVIKINAKALQRNLLMGADNLIEYVQASKDFQIPIVAVGVENQNLFRITHNHNISYAQGLFLCPPLCLNNPQKFYTHLNTYFDIKNSLLGVEKSSHTLKAIALSLVEAKNDLDIKKEEQEEEQEEQVEQEEQKEQVENELSNFETPEVKIPKIDSLNFIEDMPKEYHLKEENSELENIQQSTEKVIHNINQKNPAVENVSFKSNFNFSGRQAFGNRQHGFGKKQQS